MYDVLLEAFEHPCFGTHSEFFNEGFVEMVVAHSGEKDELFYV